MTAVTLTADMRIMLTDRFQHELRSNLVPGRVVVRSLQREVFADVHERQAEINHQQTLERLRERGGLDAVEAVAVLTCLKFDEVRDVPEWVAHRILYTINSILNRGRLDGLAGHRPR